MIITITNRRTKEITTVDVNAEGNVHDLEIQQGGSRYVIQGEPYGRGLQIRERDGRTVQVESLGAVNHILVTSKLRSGE